MRLGPDLVWQLGGESLGAVAEQVMQGGSGMSPTRLVHVVNLFCRDGAVPDDQLETAAAIGRAQRSSEIETMAVVVVDAGDETEVGRVVADRIPNAEVVTGRFAGPIPEVFEILRSAADATADDDYLVLTNADICPVPGFYDGVAALIHAGAHSLVVNRRSVFGFFPGETSAPLAAHALGAAHPGFDCFVFEKGLVSSMVATDAVVGSAYVMLSILFNLVARSEPLVVLTDAHLTYHFGDDRNWSSDGRSASVERNLAAARRVRDEQDEPGDRRLRTFFEAFPNWEPDAIGG